jgi:hypothetical protein
MSTAASNATAAIPAVDSIETIFCKLLNQTRYFPQVSRLNFFAHENSLNALSEDIYVRLKNTCL